MGGGKAAAPTKPNRQRAPTHRANVYGPMCKVKFVYKDDPKKPLKNRYVLYWLYNSKGTDLDSNPEDPYYWYRQGTLMPGACGKTSGDGSLTKSYRLSGMMLVDDTEGPRYLEYRRLANENEEQNRIYPRPLLSTDAFPQGRKVGFMLLPPDVLTGFRTTDLRKITAAGGAWIDKITKDGQVIEIRCTLPEWIYRIKREVKLLKYHQEKYGQYVKKHLESVSHVDVMSTFVQCMIRYPPEAPNYIKIQYAKILLRKLEQLKKSIGDAYITNTDASSECGKLLSRIDNTAKSLWKLINNKALVDELKRYMPHVIDKPKEGEHGPDTKAEHGWKEIFDVLGQAYEALAKSSIGEKVFTDHIKPVFEYLESLCAEAHPTWPSNEGSLIDELKKGFPAKTFSMSDNPLLSAIDQYGSLVQTATSDAPGLPCLVEAIINSYGLRMAEKISQRNPVTAAEHIRSLFGFLKIVRMGKPLTLAQQYKLAQAANWGDLKTGKAALFEFTTEFMGERYSVTAARVFHGGMFLLAIVTFGAAVTADDDITIRKWAKIIGGASNLALTSMGIFLSKYQAATLFKIGTTSLGIIAGIAGVVISSIDAYQYFKEGETARAIWSLVAAGGSLALTIGFGIMAFGAGTSWTGIGTLLILVGVVVTVVAAIALLVMSLFQQETESAFATMRKALMKDDSVYATEYVKNATVKSAFDGVLSAEKDSKWWLMSWRAIVPLYNLGFRVIDPDTKQESLMKTAQSIEKIINDDFGGFKVMIAYLILYKKACNNSTLDDDKSGTPDFQEWQNGTIFPKRLPLVNTTVV